jgi:hypothetical protein
MFKNIKNQIKELEERLEYLENQVWELSNPPKYKSGDELIELYFAGTGAGYERDVTVISVKEVKKRHRIYYASDTPATEPINIIEVYESNLFNRKT